MGMYGKAIYGKAIYGKAIYGKAMAAAAAASRCNEDLFFLFRNFTLEKVTLKIEKC